MAKRTILDFFGKSTVQIERDENNKSGIGGNNLNRTNSGDSATDDNENVSVHENETDMPVEVEDDIDENESKNNPVKKRKYSFNEKRKTNRPWLDFEKEMMFCKWCTKTGKNEFVYQR